MTKRAGKKKRGVMIRRNEHKLNGGRGAEWVNVCCCSIVLHSCHTEFKVNRLMWVIWPSSHTGWLRLGRWLNSMSSISRYFGDLDRDLETLTWCSIRPEKWLEVLWWRARVDASRWNTTFVLTGSDFIWQRCIRSNTCELLWQQSHLAPVSRDDKFISESGGRELTQRFW